jgi:hypothetical protein
MSGLKVPQSAEEITQVWLKSEMQDALKGQEVEVIELNAIQDNAGMLSRAFKAKVKIIEEAHHAEGLVNPKVRANKDY